MKETEIARENIVLLEELRKSMIKRFEKIGATEIIQIFKNMPLNSLIRILNFGFSEKVFFKESMQGKFKFEPFDLSSSELEIIVKNIKKFFK